MRRRRPLTHHPPGGIRAREATTSAWSSPSGPLVIDCVPDTPPDQGLTERAAGRHHVVPVPLRDGDDPIRRDVPVREPERDHGAVGEPGRRVRHDLAREQPLDLGDASVHPGQVVELFQLDGRVSPVPEIGILGVLTAELDGQPVALLARLGQLMFEALGPLGSGCVLSSVSTLFLLGEGAVLGDDAGDAAIVTARMTVSTEGRQVVAR